MSFFYQLLIISATVGSSVIAYVGRPSFIAVVSAFATAVKSWSSYLGKREKIEQYTDMLRQTAKLLSWWDSLSNVEKANGDSINYLVETGEAIIASELNVIAMRSAEVDDDDTTQKNDKNKSLEA